MLANFPNNEINARKFIQQKNLNCRRIYRQTIKRQSPPRRRKKLTVLEITYGGDNIIMVSLLDKSNSLNPKDDASI